MADKITKQYKFAASGILEIDENDIMISVEDKGDFSLRELLNDFDGKPIKISCSYDEDYEKPETVEDDID